MESIEKTAETVEEAISAGLEELGVQPSEVMVEVIEEPSKGLFGIGAKPARVRLILMGGRREVESPPRPEPVRHPEPVRRSEPVVSDHDDDDDDDATFDQTSAEVSDEEADEDALVGRQVLSDLLERMSLEDMQISIRRAESHDGEETHWVLNIDGDETSSLIGRRGETLAALQYITRLIVSRRLQRRANVIVDAGRYKMRRSDRLRQLAERMADQAVREQRTITLEPMPPHERRIVHLTLRERQDVITRSVGEARLRKVTIVPAD